MKDKSCRDKCQAVQVVEDAAVVVLVAAVPVAVIMVEVIHRVDTVVDIRHTDIRLIIRQEGRSTCILARPDTDEERDA